MKSIYSVSNKINFYAECKKIYLSNPNSDLYIFHDNNIILNQEFDNDEITIANPSIFSEVNPHNNIIHDTIVLPQKYAKILLNYNEKAALFVLNLFLYLIKKIDLPYKYLSNINNSELEQDLTIARSLKEYFDNKNYSPVSYGYLDSLNIFGDSIFVRKILPSSNINDLLSFKHSNKNSNKSKIAFCFLMRTQHNQPKVWEEFFRNEKDYKVYVHTTEYVDLDWNIPHKMVLHVDSAYGFVNRVYEELMKTAINDDPSLTHFIFLSESCVPIKSMSVVREICVKDKSWIEEIDESEYDKNNSIRYRLSNAINELLKCVKYSSNLPDKRLYKNINKHKPHFILCRKDAENFLNTSNEYKNFYEQIHGGNEHFLSYLNLDTKLRKSNKFYMKWDPSELNKKYYNQMFDMENKYKQYYLGLDKLDSLCDPILIDYLLGLYKPHIIDLFNSVYQNIFWYYYTLNRPYPFTKYDKNIKYLNGQHFINKITYWDYKLKIIKYFNKNNIPIGLKREIGAIKFIEHIILYDFLKKIIVNPKKILYITKCKYRKEVNNSYPSFNYFYRNAKYYTITYSEDNTIYHNIKVKSKFYKKFDKTQLNDIIVEVLLLKQKIESFNYESKIICLFVHILFMKFNQDTLIIVLNKNKKKKNNELYKKIKAIIEECYKEKFEIFNNSINLLIKDLEGSNGLDIKQIFTDKYKESLDFLKKYNMPITNKFLNFKFK